MTKVAILQSNYIPWKGYFDLINSVDHFVVYDTAQYTKGGWRNRNKIKTADGLKWLTVPVMAKGKGDSPIREMEVPDFRWQRKHWASLQGCYGKAPYFHEMRGVFEDFYKNNKRRFLSEINLELMTIINEILGIDTKIHFAGDFRLQEGKSERLLGICKDLNAETYLSGPAARDYLDEELFTKEGIGVEWMDYGGYKEYWQSFPPFEHGVTILDLLFNEGPNATRFMKSFS